MRLNKVVSRILYLIVFDSFWYSGDCFFVFNMFIWSNQDYKHTAQTHVHSVNSVVDKLEMHGIQIIIYINT